MRGELGALFRVDYLSGVTLCCLVLLLIFIVFVGNSSIYLHLKPSRASSKLNLQDEATNNSETAPKAAEPYFIVPPGFRANTFFVGMGKELLELDRRLFDKRRWDGTACVLIHGQPGSGKSHLARQYIHQYRGKFSGGIFWIPARLREEIDQAFWTIHHKIVVRELPNAGEDGTTHEISWLERVKAWFEARHEWLMVFDGIVVDKDEDATALQRYIPDSRNSSIIYISHAKSLESKQRLLRPYPIRVSALKEDDARKLLFKELNIEKPTEAELKSASELVQKIGGLPLAINAISHRLADTKQPLTKYNIKSYSADPKIAGTYNKILDDLRARGHIEAWNLIHILCFFGPHIPMEMIHLGLRAIRSQYVNVKTSEGEAKPDINTTIGILRRYALIERNEPDDKQSMSSSRDSLVEPEPIDMLKLHSVVQNFCCDSLHGQNTLSRWLGFAVNLFTYSYRQASIKIKRNADPGPVSDYHYYLVHGRRLRDHSLQYETKPSSLDSLRAELDTVLKMIEEEIRVREPTSSQEGVSRGIPQVSIFDRTSSSSESGPSVHYEARTPNHDRYRPAPLPLAGQNMYGFDADRPSIDSPASLRTSPSYTGPRIAGNSPHLLMLPYPDEGYDSDLENLDTRGALKRHKIPSDSGTARPPPPAQSLTSPSLLVDEGWQIVSPIKRPKTLKAPRRPRRDLGSFRPTPASPELDRKIAIGSVARPVQEASSESGRKLRSTSDALAALAQVQHRSPPRSSGGTGEGISFRQRSPPPPSQALSSSQQRSTYADAVARERGKPAPKPSNNTTTKTASPPLNLAQISTNAQRDDRNQSRDRSGRSNTPVTSEFIASFGNLDSMYNKDTQEQEQQCYLPVRATMHSENTPALRTQSLGPHPDPDQHHSISHLSDSSRPRYANESFHPNYYHMLANPIQALHQPAPLTIDHNVTISATTPKHSFPATFFLTPRHTPPGLIATSQPPPNISRAYMPAVPFSPSSSRFFPPGYSSQPISRQHSGQSHPSLPETEPLRYHPSGLSPPPIHDFHSAFIGDRNRHSGNGLSDSATMERDDPYRPQSLVRLSSSPSLHGEDPAQTLRGAGGWILPSQPPPKELSMSRSSSGPGIRVEGAPGEGLGIFRFETAGLVQFGEQPPISIDEARRRTEEHERRIWLLKLTEKGQRKGLDGDERGRTQRDGYGTMGWEWERERERNEGREDERRGRARMPYPDFNPIPTMTG